MSDVRLQDEAVVVDGDLRLENGSITAEGLSAPAIDGHRGRFLYEVSGTEVRAQVLVVTDSVRASTAPPTQSTAALPVRAVSVALDHPTAPRLKKSPPVTALRGDLETSVQRPPIDQPPGPRPEPMIPIPPRLALTHDYGAGVDRLVLNHQRRYVQGVHVDGDLVVGGAISQASSAKLKDDVETLPVEDAASLLAALHPVTFRYRHDTSERRHAGFIAEEVAEVMPDADGDRVRPMDLIALLTAVVQDQQRTLARLTEEIGAVTQAGLR
jgi:Chaperone of endosialidase